MLGQPLFPGESGIDQLVEIIKVLGTPTREQIRTMNPNYMEHKFPQIKPHPFSKVFRKADANALDLIARLLEYTPTERLGAIDAMVHPFFDELRDPSTKLPDSRHSSGQLRDLPNLFDFSRHGKLSPFSLSVCYCDTAADYDHYDRIIHCTPDEPEARAPSYEGCPSIPRSRYR